MKEISQAEALWNDAQTFARDILNRELLDLKWDKLSPNQKKQFADLAAISLNEEWL